MNHNHTENLTSIYSSGSYDKSICLWDVKTAQQKGKLEGHTDTVFSVCFSIDDTTLASGSRDESIRIWDFMTVKYSDIDNRCLTLKDYFGQPDLNNLTKNFGIILSKISAKNQTNIRISQSLLFQAQDAQIYKGEFINYQNVNLKSLFSSKGSVFVENLLQKN